ncbi:MAG: hypothetical protein K6E50_01710 [Lachnospiraceae bacterium]|nr:hypothetical protein [Lachnospiraceae bacterium]
MKAKKRCMRAVAGMIGVVLLTGCVGSEKPESRGRYQETGEGEGGIKVQADLPENEILMISYSTNGAWYVEDQGYFVDTDGDVYGFDSSRESYNYHDGEYMDLHSRLLLIREYTEPSGHVDPEIVMQMYSLGEQIDPDKGFEGENVACDAGQTTLYYYDADTSESVQCCSYGDMEEHPLDKSAQKLEKLFYDEMRSAKIERVKFYDGYMIPMLNLHCGYMDGMEGGYYLQDQKELREFAAQTGLKLDDIFSDMTDYEKEEYSYFVQIVNVSSGGYDLKSCGIMCDRGVFRFVPSPDSRSPEEGATVTQAMDGFCYVAGYPEHPDAAAVEAACGWIGLEEAASRFGWTVTSGPGKTGVVNPELDLYDDGGVPVRAEEFSTAPAIIYPAEGFALDTENSTTECAIYYLEEWPEYEYKVYADMPGADSDYFYYGVEPNDQYSFNYYGKMGFSVNGHEVCWAERFDPLLDEEGDMYYIYFMYGPDASPYALTIALPDVVMMGISDGTFSFEQFAKEVFGLE